MLVHLCDISFGNLGTLPNDSHVSKPQPSPHWNAVERQLGCDVPEWNTQSDVETNRMFPNLLSLERHSISAYIYICIYIYI